MQKGKPGKHTAPHFLCFTFLPFLKHVARGHFHGNRMKFRGSRPAMTALNCVFNRKVDITRTVLSFPLFQIISVTIFVLHTKQYLAIATCLCFVEINSVFLHLRRLMRFHGWNSSHLAYKLNRGVLFITFIALRFIFLLCLSAYFIFKRQKMPLSHFLIGTFGFTALIIINLILFPLLWRSEFVIKKSQSNGHMNGFVAEKVN